MPRPAEATELLDVQMQQATGVRILIAGGRLNIGQAIEVPTLQNACHRAAAKLQQRADLMVGLLALLLRNDLLLELVRDGMQAVMRA